VAQRQLILIGKVLQNLANMTMPGAKEQFMQQLSDFFARNIPKMKEFYKELLTNDGKNGTPTQIVTVTETVRNNAMCQLWDQVHANEKKLRSQFDTDLADEKETLQEMHGTLSELLEKYPKKPKKLTGDKKGGAKGGKKDDD
jgi:hypothetical protein